jgi:pimeloyl-ACP methyl ester carboxylesterase
MLVDLVHVVTSDGVRLDGMLQASHSAAAIESGVDVVCMIHGTGGSFYSSTLFDHLGERLLASGVTVLRVNTRGHDGISTAVTTQGGRRIGAAYEVVDDCRHDVAAWVELLGRRGFRRIGLVGHSLGAVKCVYALAHERSIGVAGLAAISPPRLSYSHFVASLQGGEFLETYRAADRLVQAGRSATLIEVKLPLPFVVTAGGYVEKYGPDERYNFLKYVERLSCPALFTFGAIELASNMAFHGLPEALGPPAAKQGRTQVVTVSGADHFYSAARGPLSDQVLSWLHSLPPAQ